MRALRKARLLPPLAETGVDVARAYADIAPWGPHALHVPPHVFARLGMGRESIESNLASADAARNCGKEQRLDGMTFEELPALDYLVYAFLQTGQDDKAKAIVDRVTAVRHTVPEIDLVASCAVGAVPARYAVECHAWAEAAALPTPVVSSRKKLPFTEALGAPQASSALPQRWFDVPRAPPPRRGYYRAPPGGGERGPDGPPS